MKNQPRLIAGGIAALQAVLGTPALVLSLVSLVLFLSGLFIVQREYDQLTRTGEEVIQRIIGRWTRTASADYLGLRNLADEADDWRRAPAAAEPEAQAHAVASLQRMGAWFETQNDRAPLLEILEMRLTKTDQPDALVWRSRGARSQSSATVRVPLLAGDDGLPGVRIDVRYQLEPVVNTALRSLRTSYRRLLIAVLVLSGYSLLCLVYMGLHAQAARRLSAHEAAQQATIELADRTCHELGNLAYVLGNEGRNLDDHLGVVARVIDDLPQALDEALRRAGISGVAADKFRVHLTRALAERGIDPATDLGDSLALAREVCDQIAIGAKYMNLTVRELDSYLKQSALPLCIESLDAEACIDDAVTLLSPVLQRVGAVVERSTAEAGNSRLLADRRLLVHALVNVLKNSVEACAASGRVPHIATGVQQDANRVTIELCDNGPGIAPADLSRVFDAGFSTKGVSRGRGLAIVKASIEQQGGTIRVTSQPGAGACFQLSLPREGAKRGSISGSFLVPLGRSRGDRG